ncbi:hypothetical protein [Nannocystis bainbridge]|uniref:Uncharacterized protein n=1 Tax=Nannocystis bainbridge TaxID=2995303 RepID=A0ABT5E508_9BACT|nr:hypothetical protein [Nannocystis bainbridge]MDC0720810.1 hypothetical protein [Nannocystis bainbridge]
MADARPPREGGADARPPREGAADARPPRDGDRGDRRPGDGPRGDRPRRDDGPRGDRRDDRRDDRRGGPPPRRDSSSSPLTASLFSAVQDKEMPCRIAGCENTWTWFAAQQIRGFGQRPPDRMCDHHLTQFSELSDREVHCRTPGCPNTWLWKRGAQLAELQRHGRLKKPARLCNECVAAERETGDAEMPCKVEGCRRSWIWTRDAQLRHRLWVLRQRARARAVEARHESAAAAEVEATADAPVPSDLSSETPVEVGTPVLEAMSPATDEAAPAGGEAHEVGDSKAGPGKKRRRRRKQHVRAEPDPEGPPQRMCGLCAQKLGRLVPREVPCKVHGCVRTWTWDRAGQLRAWVLSGSDDVEFEPAAPKRMCEACREFCRKHPDREIHCGRPGCPSVWMYKTGAQLQAFLAGRLQDPLKLCDECAKGEFAKTIEEAGLPEGAEIMPCVVPACDGNWVYMPGQKLMHVPDGELAPDRMCLKCKRERGLAPPEEIVGEPIGELEVSPEDTEASDDESDADELLADDPEPAHDDGAHDAADDAAHDDAAHDAADDAAHDDAAHDAADDAAHDDAAAADDEPQTDEEPAADDETATSD